MRMIHSGTVLVIVVFIDMGTSTLYVQVAGSLRRIIIIAE